MIPEHKKLNMGCGFKKLNDHWNVDVSPKCNPDEVLEKASADGLPDEFLNNVADEVDERLNIDFGEY